MKDDSSSGTCEFSPLVSFEIHNQYWLGFCVKCFLENEGHTSSDHFVLFTYPNVKDRLSVEKETPDLSSFQHELKSPLQDNVLLRIHSECLMGDLLGVSSCDCGWQLQRALEQIRKERAGILIYLRQEGRGIGLFDKLRALDMPNTLDTFQKNEAIGLQADRRKYDLVPQILERMGVNSVRLITGNPQKVEALRDAGIPVQVEAFDYSQVLNRKNGKMQDELDAKVRRGYRYIMTRT